MRVSGGGGGGGRGGRGGAWRGVGRRRKGADAELSLSSANPSVGYMTTFFINILMQQINPLFSFTKVYLAPGWGNLNKYFTRNQSVYVVIGFFALIQNFNSILSYAAKQSLSRICLHGEISNQTRQNSLPVSKWHRYCL